MMDSSHHQTTIHTLAGPTRGNGGGGNQSNKQHPMQHQFQHTQQPLVNTTSQNHQLLQFHHSPNQQQQQLHPYSTLSTMQHHTGNSNNSQHLSLLNQLQHLNGGGPVSQSNGFSNLFANQTLHRPTSSQNSASSQATTLGNFHLNNHHLQQQLHFGNSSSLQHQLLLNQTSSQNSSSSSGAGGGPHSQQQAAYNVNSSDYSSSTYHVYDQILGDQIIDDLIVIKQERMKKKLEQEQRRKVILFSLAVILLVGLLMFLIVQLLRATNSNGMPQATFTSPSVTISPLSLPRIETGNDNNQNQNQNNFPSQRTHWGAPPGGVDTNQWQYVPPGRFVPRPSPSYPTDMKPSLTPHQNPFVPQPARPQPMPPVSAASTTQQPIVVLPSVSGGQQPSSSSLPQAPPSSSQTTQPPSSSLSSSSSQMRQSPTTSDNNNLRCHGKHCNPTSGCPNQCSGRGFCVKSVATSQPDNQWHQATVQHQEWRCQCPAGTTGDDCGILIERQCDDGLDNDKDGLVDCADSECCGDAVCQNSTYCVKSPDPLDILMRKSPLPPTSSFFQRMHFLIEKSSSQIYSKLQDFSDSPWASPRNVDRASVIRGRVTYQRQGVTGVRVSIVGQTNLGITLSRDGGYFDLMVNGGGVILVEFKREPFATFQKAVRVPWNEIVLIDSIELQLANNNQDTRIESTLSKQSQALIPEADAPTCLAHNYQVMRPQVTAISRTSKSSASSTLNTPTARHHNPSQQHQAASGKLRAVVLREFGTVQQSIVLPQSASGSQSNDSVSIVYVSSKAREFMSTINIQLTPAAMQLSGESKRQIDELRQIHLKIVLEGVLFEQSFEPQWNLSFTYAWNRQNVYKQKSFGLSTASVSVGYEYSDCKHIIWATRQVRLMGHDLPISEIGAQWNLNIHHRYNYRDSILQRGDGQDYLLKTDRLPVVVPVMGDGYPRQQNCPFCDGATSPSEQKLLRPQALVSAPDGSIYVGDHNMIRRIEPPAPLSASVPVISLTGSGVSTGGQASLSSSALSAASERAVRTVLEMNAGRVPDEYSLALNLAPAEAPQLHLVDASHNQILVVREQRSATSISADSSNETTPPSSTLEDTLVPVVGTGEKCQPDDRQSCGDGQAAKLARLIEPRAAVFDLAGRMYIADGPNVRLVDLDQRIYTILGDYSPHHQRQHHQTKFPCSGEAIAMHKFSPRAPRDLAINPIDETLHVLDENVVYKITQDKRVQVVAGRPAHCAASIGVLATSGQQQRASQVSLQAAGSIAFNQMGQLFIGEDDPLQTTGRVLLVTPEDDSISLYAGQPNQDSSSQVSFQQQQQQQPLEATQLLGTKQRSSNALPPMGAQATRAPEHKFSSVAALAVDQLGNLLVADKLQLRVLSIEPDLPQLNSMGEYEIQSPDEPNELLVFNRHGLQVAARELTGNGQSLASSLLGATNSALSSQHQRTKYTFAYNVNTSYGLLASVSYANGNKVSIYRDAPHHSVKLIETAFGGQCKLDVSRQGQVHSIATVAAGPSAPASSKISMTYHGEGGGLLKQTRDQMTGEQFDFSYDEFGRATAIQQQQVSY